MPAPQVSTVELRQPGRIPNQILIDDGDPQPAFISDSTGPGLPGGIPAFDAPQVITPTPAPSAPPPTTPARIRVGGSVQAGKILRQVSPVYPALARQARISGQVRLEAIIAKNGKIENLQVLSGPPLLVQAALEAVRQWVYRPTLLNGDPVEVVTLIDVNFGLR
jgi:protein TonB